MKMDSNIVPSSLYATVLHITKLGKKSIDYVLQFVLLNNIVKEIKRQDGIIPWFRWLLFNRLT